MSKKVDIEIKNIKVRLPRKGDPNDSTDFTADIYINGVKAAYAHNDGWGGPTSISPTNSKGAALITSAENYLDSLPEVPARGVPDRTIKEDLELRVNRVAAKEEHRKALDKIAKNTLTKVTQLEKGVLLQFSGKVKVDVELKPYLDSLHEDGEDEPVLLQSLSRSNAIAVAMLMADGSLDKQDKFDSIAAILEEEGYSSDAIERATGHEISSSPSPR